MFRCAKFGKQNDDGDEYIIDWLKEIKSTIKYLEDDEVGEKCTTETCDTAQQLQQKQAVSLKIRVVEDEQKDEDNIFYKRANWETIYSNESHEDRKKLYDQKLNWTTNFSAF